MARKHRTKRPTDRNVPKPAARTIASDKEEVRLNQFMARSGVCSRREADKLIARGEVAVNGKKVTELGSKVTPRDTIEVHGRKIVPLHLAWYILNKPSNVITTTKDERGRKCVMDLFDLPEKEKDGLFPVGRLDRDTTGVLLVTNDGDLAHRLMHPSYEIDKMYLVRTDTDLKDEDLAALLGGVTLDDGPAAAGRAAFPDPSVRNVVGISIHEGRNRQVRRMFEALGHDVVSLERIKYAGLTAKGIRRGKWRRLSRDEVSALYRKVKL